MQFTIIPSHYNSTTEELVKLANQLAMSPQIVQSPFRRPRFSFRAILRAPRSLLHAHRNPSITQSISPSVRIFPHGLTPEDRLHSLMFFFHCLGLSKRDLPE